MPLINIVLLLVLSFMMAGTLATPLPSGFDPLRSEVGEPVDGVATPMILTIDGSGDLFVEGRDISASDVDLLFGALSNSGRGVEFRVDARAPARTVIVLLGIAERAGIKDAQIVTLRRE